MQIRQLSSRNVLIPESWALVLVFGVGLLIGSGFILRILALRGLLVSSSCLVLRVFLIGGSSILRIFLVSGGLVSGGSTVLGVGILGCGLVSSVGVFRVGVFSVGILSSGLIVRIGIFCVGIFSIGVFSVGVFSIGVFSSGLVGSVGVLGVGILGVGVLGVGLSGSSLFIGSSSAFRIGSLSIGAVSSGTGVSTSRGLLGLVEHSGSLVGQSIVLGDLGSVRVVGGRVELDVGGSGTGLGNIVGDVLVQLGLLLGHLGGNILALCSLDGQPHGGGRELEDLVLGFAASKGKCVLTGLGGGNLSVEACDLCSPFVS